MDSESGVEKQVRSHVEAQGGNWFLVIWPVILHVTRSHKRTKDVVTRRVFDSSKAFGSRAPPRPTGELERSPELLAAIGGGVLLLRSREGSGGKREGRGGNRKERKIEWRG